MISLTRLALNIKWQQLKSVTSVHYLRLGCYRCTPVSKANTLCPKRFIQNDTTKHAKRRTESERIILHNEFAVDKDTILYKYEDKGGIKLLNFSALCQFIFGTLMIYTATSTMKNIPITEEVKNDKKIPWWKKVNMGMYKYGLVLFSIFSILVGGGALAMSWTYSLRFVKCLVLKKGGNQLLFVTHTPFLRSKSILIPIKEVSAVQSRASSTVYLPLKVKGKYWYKFFFLNMKGEFPNTRLFDYSAGLSRNWSK